MIQIGIIFVLAGSVQAFEFLRSLSTLIYDPEVTEGDTQGSIDIFYRTFKKHPMKLPDTVYEMQDQIKANPALVQEEELDPENNNMRTWTMYYDDLREMEDWNLLRSVIGIELTNVVDEK